MNIYIGIDPGLSTGGISLLMDDLRLVTKMTPRIGDDPKGDIDLVAMSDYLIEAAMTIIWSGGGVLGIGVEDVHSIHGSSAGSNFSFGERKGELSGMATMIGRVFGDRIKRLNLCDNNIHTGTIDESVSIRIEKVQPKVWQKEVWNHTDKHFSDNKVNTKLTSIACAQRLFPGHNFCLPYSGKGKVPTKIQDGMCDSALIAEYVRRVININ